MSKIILETRMAVVVCICAFQEELLRNSDGNWCLRSIYCFVGTFTCVISFN